MKPTFLVLALAFAVAYPADAIDAPTPNELNTCAGSPIQLTAVVTGTTVTLTWLAPSIGCPPPSYVISAGSAPGLSNLAEFSTGTPATTLTVPGVPLGTYYVRVASETAAGRSLPSNEITVVVSGGAGLPPPDRPLVLTGAQTVVISNVDYTFKNNIILRDNSMLVIRNATFTHATDYAGQYDLWAYDNSKVIIENSTVKSTPWVNWRFFGTSALELTNVVNGESAIWTSVQERATATFTNVSRVYCTGAESTSIVVRRAAETFIETVFPPNAIVNESFPSTVGPAGYRFPDANEQGVSYTVTIADATAARWGITYQPQSNVTIANTSSLVVTFNIPATYNGLTAQFDNLRATHYADQTWTTGGSVLRLINTTTERWSPIVSGNNSLIVTNSDLADNHGSYGTATVSIADSSLTYVRSNDFVRFNIVRSSILGDVVAGGNSIIQLTSSTVAGRIVREGNGQVILTDVLTTSPGFTLQSAGSITTQPAELISGRGSIKGSYSGPQTYNGYLQTDPALIRFSANRTYRVTFRYRILVPSTRGFEVLFKSNAAFAAGVFLPSVTLTGAAGESGTATLTNTLGPYADYQAAWNIIGSGAIVIDDIQIVDVATGQVVALENAETVATSR